MERKNAILVIIITIIVLVVGSTIAILYSNNYNDEHFSSSLEKSYESYTKSRSQIEKYNKNAADLYADVFNLKTIEKTIKELKEIKKTNNETRNYLKESLKFTNDNLEKQYIELLIEQTEIIDSFLNEDIEALNWKKNYSSGKIGVDAHNNKMRELGKHNNNTFKKGETNAKKINDIISKNQNLGKKLNNLNIGVEFLGSSYANTLFLPYE